jgi:hypothetical protein
MLDFLRKRPWALSYVFLVVGFIGCLLLVQNESQNRQEQTCEERLAGRAVLRAIVVLATDGDGIDLTVIDGFEELDEPTQQFFHNLAALSQSNSGDNSSFRREALAQIPLPDCDGDGEPDDPPQPITTGTTTGTTPPEG